MLEIHEETGNTIAIRYDYPELFGQRPRDLGELTVFAVAGTLGLSIIAIAYFTSSDRFKLRSRTLFQLKALMAIFGIVVDALHIMFLHRGAGALFGLIEDGGELIVLSMIAWYVWCLVGSPHSNRDSTTTASRMG